MEAETADGACHGIILQNAETVRLVGPVAQSTAAGTAARAPLAPLLEFEADASSGDDDGDAVQSRTDGEAAVHQAQS